VRHWFDLMTNRKMSLALSKCDTEKYKEAINFLNEVIVLFRDLSVGNKNQWKPFQAAVILSTKSIIDLVEQLINDCDFQFLLTSRLTQDCIENFFSVIRKRNVVPNAVQFKNNLKLISISQYMKSVENSNYEEDDREYLSCFLKIPKTHNSIVHDVSRSADYTELYQYLQTHNVALNNTDINKLHHVAGYLIMNIFKNENVCKSCIFATGNKDANFFYYSMLTRIRARHSNTLFFVNTMTLRFVMQLETKFRIIQAYAKQYNKRKNLKKIFIKICEKISFNIPTCHNLKKKIISRFYTMRMKVSSRKFPISKNVTFASKSMAMHHNVS